MKKIKKLQSGMTLVEVIVAMAVFGTVMLAITMAFAAVVKFNMYNIMRDKELVSQQNSIEANTADGVEYVTGISGAELKFVNSAGSVVQTVNGVTGYQSLVSVIKNGKEASDSDAEYFEFNLKDLQSNAIGSLKTITDGEQYFRIYVTSLSETADYTVELKYYLGSLYDGETSNAYTLDTKTVHLSKRSTSSGVKTSDSSIYVNDCFEIGYDATSFIVPNASGTGYTYADTVNATDTAFTITVKDSSGNVTATGSYTAQQVLGLVGYYDTVSATVNAGGTLTLKKGI